jgi:hypothetical protein
MTADEPEQLGRLDDDAEEQEPSSTTEGAAADGDYDPAQGSPGRDHPTGEDFPAEASRFDQPEHRRPDTEE